MIIDIIKKDICPLHIEDEGINSLAIMDEYKTHQLPVVNGHNELLGLINENIIMNMEDLKNSLQFVRHEIHKIFIVIIIFWLNWKIDSFDIEEYNLIFR